MAELAMLVDIQWTVYPEEVTRQLRVMAQGRESSPVIDRRSNQLCYATNNSWKRKLTSRLSSEIFAITIIID